MQTRLRWVTLASLLLGAWAAPLPARAASAAGHVYQVNSPLDQLDADPTDGICASTPSGVCTLRAAIMEANFAAGPDTILLPAGTYTLTRPGYDDAALVGDLDLADNVTIQGAGSAATIVDGNGAVTHDRVFHVLGTAPYTTLSGLTIRNGQVLSVSTDSVEGGGIYIEDPGQVSLDDVIIADNTAKAGGGLAAHLTSLGGSLELNHVSLQANTAVNYGGGLFAYLGSNLSAIALSDSQVYSNTVENSGEGGGFYIESSNGDTGHWSIQRSEIYSNTASSGAGMLNDSALSLSDSRLHDNYAALDGGAILAYSPLTITRTTLEANTAGRNGGGILDEPDGSSPVYNDFDNIVQSTLSGNSAQFGGAIYHLGFGDRNAQLTLTNSTVSANGVSRDGEGGGLYVAAGLARLYNVTLADNRVRLSVPHHGSGIGAGVYVTATSAFTVTNSLIAGNIRGDGVTTPAADDCFAAPGTTGTLAYSLIPTTTQCFISGPQSGNVLDQDPLLGPLQNNGGSTPTQALLPGSPAINAGSPTGCTDAKLAPVTIDQRGAARTDARCDIGAYEVVPEADVAVGLRVSPGPAQPGEALTYTLTVTNNGPALASAVTLTDTLSSGANFISATATQGNCSGTVPTVCHLSTLASGAHATVWLTVAPMTTGLKINSALVSAAEFDPVLANNTASETTAVVRRLYLPLLSRGP